MPLPAFAIAGPFLVLALLTAIVPPATAASGSVSLQNGFARVVKRRVPAVVRVSASKMVRASDSRLAGALSEALEAAPASPGKQEEDLGSGVIVSSDGYILTNEHVIDGARHAHVTLADRREFQARIVGNDAATDIAVLKIEATGLPVMPLGDSSKMKPGDFVIAIGNPYGLSKSVTMGIVSAVGRGDLGVEDYEDFIQTDASVNPGNSGGALINVEGQLVGINTAIVNSGGGSRGVGFAIPIQLGRQVMDQIVKNGRVIRAWLGVRSQPVTPGIAKAFGLSGDPRGALISDILPDGPAAEAGLARGDIILAINGQPVPANHNLSLKIAAMAPGTTIRVQVLRTGSAREIPIRLSREPSEPEHGEAPALPSTSDVLLKGVHLVDLNGNLAERLQLHPGTHGVVIAQIQSGSGAADSGLKPGDVIEQVNHQPVPDCPSFQKVVGAAGNSPILLLVNRAGASHFLVIEPD